METPRCARAVTDVQNKVRALQTRWKWLQRRRPRRHHQPLHLDIDFEHLNEISAKQYDLPAVIYLFIPAVPRGTGGREEVSKRCSMDFLLGQPQRVVSGASCMAVNRVVESCMVINKGWSTLAWRSMKISQRGLLHGDQQRVVDSCVAVNKEWSTVAWWSMKSGHLYHGSQ